MMVPTIHLNGTARADLLADIVPAAAAVNLAIEKLQLMRPNARDYYPQGPDAYRQASEEHQSRIDSLVGVRLSLEKLYEAIDEAPGRR